MQEWILVVGGLGIVCGLALFSSNISRCLGVQVAKITFARGFSAEFGTAITVAIASRYGVCAACITAPFSHSPHTYNCSSAFVLALCSGQERVKSSELKSCGNTSCRPAGVHDADHHRLADRHRPH